MDTQVPAAVKSKFFDNLWKAASVGGKSYGIPWYVTTRVEMFNTENFREAGLDPAKPPKTWKEVEEYSRIIRQKTGKFGFMPAIKVFEDFTMEGIPIVNGDLTKAEFNTPEAAAILNGTGI